MRRHRPQPGQAPMPPDQMVPLLEEFIATHCIRGDRHIYEDDVSCKTLSVRIFRRAFKRFIGRHVYEPEIDAGMASLGFEIVPCHYTQGKFIGVTAYRDRESCVSPSENTSYIPHGMPS